MNKHILFVIDHLANPDKYTKEQLKDNAATAWAAVWVGVGVAGDDDATYAAATYATAYAYAVDAATANDYASYWVDEYFKRSGENKDDYIKELNK